MTIMIRNNEHGSTMVELLAAALMTVIIGGAALDFYVTQHKSWMIESEVAEVQQNARVALDVIADALKMGGYQLPAGHPGFRITDDSITVYYRDEATATVDTVGYFISTSNPRVPTLMVWDKNSSAEPLAEYIEDLTVTRLSPRLLQVSVIGRAQDRDSVLVAGDGYRRRTYSTRVKLRNI